MPKDPTKNVDRYKVRGGVINEYEYHENQQALVQDEAKGDGKLIPGTPPEEKPKKSTKATKTKKVSTSRKSEKAAKKATKSTPRGASAKKLAARKAAQKK
ncbi:MAG TPA: hypothetical protein VGP83_17795 [Pyrinomonadaceae bacterium]|nr:hypothetical protein [Pyrinomonadaceae bacterium]